MRRRTVAIILAALVLVCLGAVLLYNLPPIHERLAWRVAGLEAQVRRLLNPPEQVVFLPQGQGDPGAVETIVKATLDVLFPSSTVTFTMHSSPTGAALDTPQPTPTLTATVLPTFTATSIPEKFYLSGIVHEYQQFNNCGPANLSMALSFWGWQGNQNATRAYLRPNREVDDKNVMPSEMVAFVEGFTDLRALWRVGGDLDLLKRLIAAGFPVLIEKGHHPSDDWWMGHYVVVNGYDDSLGRFTVQDSLIKADFLLPYAELEAHGWRDFNYVYLVISPPEREMQVFSLLGEDADVDANFRRAAQKALAEIPLLTGRDQFFAWFNLGSSLVSLADYAGAAEAYDSAFAIYPRLSEDDRPYRLMWYQVGPYLAYYYTARYQDVINLANTTFSWVGQPVLEESYYWRAMAYEALGNLNRAISDYKKAAALNPNYLPPREALQRLGVELP